MNYEFIKTEPRTDDKVGFIFHYDCPNALESCKPFIIASYDHLSQELLKQINNCEKDFLVQAKATITTYYGEEEIKGTINVWVLREVFDNEGVCKLKMFGTQHPTDVILKRNVSNVKE